MLWRQLITKVLILLEHFSRLQKDWLWAEGLDPQLCGEAAQFAFPSSPSAAAWATAAPHSPSSSGRPAMVGTMCRISATSTGRVHRPEMPLWTSSTTFFTTGCQSDDPVRLWKQRNKLGKRRHRREIIQNCRQKVNSLVSTIIICWMASLSMSTKAISWPNTLM